MDWFASLIYDKRLILSSSNALAACEYWEHAVFSEYDATCVLRPEGTASTPRHARRARCCVSRAATPRMILFFACAGTDPVETRPS